jgi:hypothetical protein
VSLNASKRAKGRILRKFHAVNQETLFARKKVALEAESGVCWPMKPSAVTMLAKDD